MLDVRVSTETDPEALVAFVERLARSGRRAPEAVAARSRLVADLRGGRVPAGLQRLSAALDPGADGTADDQERPGTLTGAVAHEPLVVLSETGPRELAVALAELTGFGMRIVLTGADDEQLAAVRDSLPAAATGRVVDRLPALPSAQLRRLRWLLATIGTERSRLSALQLPPVDALPPVAEVTGGCARFRRVVEGTGDEVAGDVRVVPGLLRELEADRRAAVTQVARCALSKLTDIDRSPDAERLRHVAGRLVHSGLLAEFESLQSLAARQRDDREQYAHTPPIEQHEQLTELEERDLRRYLDFLEDGGRPRSYFKPAEQKDAEPLLTRFRTRGHVPATYEEVLATARHLHLARRDVEIARLCEVLDLPIPRSTEELRDLTVGLDAIAAATRSVGALRHDVLFLHRDSPVSVPDLTVAERVARAIVDFDEEGDPSEAGDELDQLAQECEDSVPAEARAPEHDAAVAALRARDPEAYAAAVEDLDRVRREVADATQLDELLDELAAGHPDLAAAWTADAAAGVLGFGLVHVVGTAPLLSSLPPADSADLVVVLGAGALHADALLLTAAAPRLLAVVGDEPRAGSHGPTLVEVLGQASACFLRGTGPVTGEVTPPDSDEPGAESRSGAGSESGSESDADSEPRSEPSEPVAAVPQQADRKSVV